MPISAASMLPTAESAWSQPSAIRPGAVGHHLGHQRDADGELAADAQAGQEAVEREVPDARREGAQAGEGRVEQDRQEHRLGPADPVAEDAEDEPADGPADHEDRWWRSRVLVDLAGRRRVAGRGVEQLRDRRLAGQVEELLVHRVEQPAQRGDDEDEPVVARQLPPPVDPAFGSVIGSGGGGVVEDASGEISGREPDGQDRPRGGTIEDHDTTGATRNRSAPTFCGRLATRCADSAEAAKIVAMRGITWLILAARPLLVVVARRGDPAAR